MTLPSPNPGSTVLVTGASTGIGADIARLLAAEGHNVTLVARRQDRLEQLAAELRSAHGVGAEVEPCDLADPAARKLLLGRLEASDRTVVGVVNNAGYGSFGRFWELDADGETRQVELNVRALHEICAALLPGMVARGEGAILNVGSLAGFQPTPLNATYAATKAFVNSFSEGLHAELAGTGVSCTVLCPGPVKTEFAEAAGVGELHESTPGFMWGTPEQVAKAAVEGMRKGKRVVIPRVSEQVLGMFGRFTPRTLMLPVMERLGSRQYPRSK